VCGRKEEKNEGQKEQGYEEGSEEGDTRSLENWALKREF
jgi:hypothetical protein